jgi:hypothetical protein
MRIVITHPLTHDSMPTNACFFCGHPVSELGISCIDDTTQDKVLGMVCTSCAQREPAQLQTALAEKASWLRGQYALLHRQAQSLLAQADRLERLAQQSLALPSATALEAVMHSAA